MMEYVELSKQENRSAFYPDLVAAGGLHMALGKALEALSSPLLVDTIENFIPYAHIQRGSRSSQIYIAAEKREFIIDFWAKGVQLGNAWTAELAATALSIHTWIIEEPNTVQMKERFGFFAPSPNAKAYESGQAVEYQWQRLLHSWSKTEEDISNPQLSPRPLIEAAQRRPELRQLFPFTSLYKLCFSRTTGYPFTDDCPHAVPLGNGLFRAYSDKHTVVTKTSRGGHEYSMSEHEILGEGDVETIMDLLVANLPSNCGPAVEGTADDCSPSDRA